VAYLANNSIMHGDIKPANIMIASGSVRLGDFGAARKCTGAVSETIRPPSRLSMTSMLCGTPRYMPPEAWQADVFGAIGLPFDTWSLACVLLEMYTLRPAFGAQTVGAIVGDVCDGPTPDIPILCPIRGVLRRMLVKPTRTRLAAGTVARLLKPSPFVVRGEPTAATNISRAAGRRNPQVNEENQPPKPDGWPTASVRGTWAAGTSLAAASPTMARPDTTSRAALRASCSRLPIRVSRSSAPSRSQASVVVLSPLLAQNNFKTTQADKRPASPPKDTILPNIFSS